MIRPARMGRVLTAVRARLAFGVRCLAFGRVAPWAAKRRAPLRGTPATPGCHGWGKFYLIGKGIRNARLPMPRRCSSRPLACPLSSGGHHMVVVLVKCDEERAYAASSRAREMMPPSCLVNRTPSCLISPRRGSLRRVLSGGVVRRVLCRDEGAETGIEIHFVVRRGGTGTGGLPPMN